MCCTLIEYVYLGALAADFDSCNTNGPIVKSQDLHLTARFK